MILRELLAVFGLDYDGDGQAKAEKGLTALKSQADNLAGTFSQVLTAGAIATPFVFLAKMASDANENLNLLQLAFGDSADSVVEWSNKAGPAMGRSRFTMRELAAEFGGLLAPMVGVGEELSEMSTGLAQLAVDLSSARNITENEALAALQSGLAGNIIAMKRFGSNLSMVRVQQEAVNRGWGKATKNLTQAQLASIRYSLITKDLAFIQGDAANTLDQYANSTRAMRDALKEIGTELGLFLLPAFEESLRSTREMLAPIRDMAEAFREWAADTNLAQAAVMALSLIMGATLLPILLKVLVPMLAFAAFAIILDDIITSFEGGNSVLLTFAKILDELEKEGFPGMGAAAAVAMETFNDLREVIGAVMAVVVSLFDAILEGDFTDFKRTIDVVAKSFDDWMESLGAWGQSIKVFLRAITSPFVALGGIIAGIIEAISTRSFAPLKGAIRGIKGLALDDLEEYSAILSPQAAAFAAAGKERILGGGKLGANRETIGHGGGSTLTEAGLESRNVVINEGGKTYNFDITQQPGEDSVEFATRVGDIIDQQQRQRDQAIANELLQLQPGET